MCQTWVVDTFLCPEDLQICMPVRIAPYAHLNVSMARMLVNFYCSEKEDKTNNIFSVDWPTHAGARTNFGLKNKQKNSKNLAEKITLYINFTSGSTSLPLGCGEDSWRFSIGI